MLSYILPSAQGCFAARRRLSGHRLNPLHASPESLSRHPAPAPGPLQGSPIWSLPFCSVRSLREQNGGRGWSLGWSLCQQLCPLLPRRLPMTPMIHNLGSSRFHPSPKRVCPGNSGWLLFLDRFPKDGSWLWAGSGCGPYQESSPAALSRMRICTQSGKQVSGTQCRTLAKLQLAPHGGV